MRFIYKKGVEGRKYIGEIKAHRERWKENVVSMSQDREPNSCDIRVHI